MRKSYVIVAVVAILLGVLAVPAQADHDWASGCSTSGNTCWWETGNGGGLMQSDHRDSYTFNDWYAGNPNQSIGWHTDWFRNKMNTTRAYLYRSQNYGGYLFCVNPASTTWYWVGGTTTTGSWKGKTGWRQGCRS